MFKNLNKNYLKEFLVYKNLYSNEMDDMKQYKDIISYIVSKESGREINEEIKYQESILFKDNIQPILNDFTIKAIEIMWDLEKYYGIEIYDIDNFDDVKNLNKLIGERIYKSNNKL